MAEYLVTGDWERYRQARERALRSPWSRIAAGFPGSPDLPLWTFIRGVADYDPMPYWIQLTEPTLVVYGELDEQDNVPVKESVRRLEHAFGAAGKRNYRIVVIPGTGHALTDPQRRELMPAFVEVLRAWLRENVLVSSGGGAGAAGADAGWLETAISPSGP